MINKLEKIKYLKLIIYILSSLYLIFFIEFQYSPDVNKFIKLAEEPLSAMTLRYFNIVYFFTIMIYKVLLYLPNWETFFILLNFNCFFFVMYNIFLVCKKIKIFQEKNNILFVYIFILGLYNYEFSQWIRYGTSDLILILFITYCFRLFIENRILQSLIIYILPFFIKPQSIIFFIFVFLNVTFKKINFNLKKFLIFLIFLFLSFLLFYFIIISNDYLKYIFYKIFIEKNLNGTIIVNRVYINIFEFSIFNFLKLYSLKFIYFFSIYFEAYSLEHKIYNLIYFIYLYLPIIYGIFVYKKFPKIEKMVLINCLLIISVTVIFFVITLIDYDLRYRAYTYPFFIILNAISLNIFMKKNFN
tara:strand:- start:781 stop:1854 length:1074 start_codon:yes stop_codon:yes gene_type:complete